MYFDLCAIFECTQFLIRKNIWPTWLQVNKPHTFSLLFFDLCAIFECTQFCIRKKHLPHLATGHQTPYFYFSIVSYVDLAHAPKKLKSLKVSTFDKNSCLIWRETIWPGFPQTAEWAINCYIWIKYCSFNIFVFYLKEKFHQAFLKRESVSINCYIWNQYLVF